MVEVLSQCHAVFPDKPTGMSLAEYEMHINNGQCARLLRGECHSPCQPLDGEGGYSVDFDHILPKSYGGQNSGWNLEPKCSGYNQWVKGASPDKTFENTFHFDLQINNTLLRENQNTHGYKMVTGVYRNLFECPSKQIQSVFMLLVWMVGTGKSIGMVAILHAINEAINAKASNSPRIRKVLWLVHQESLVKSIKDEVENEPFQYGILTQKPKVSIVENAQSWSTAIQEGDYVFACTQSLWDRQNAVMTAIDRAKYLSQFDAIVIDECHYAVDRYVEILQNAPRALKFVMTATPMDDKGQLLSSIDNGKYKNLFKLFSVFGYEMARQHGFVKNVPSWEEGLISLRYIPVEGGDSEVVLAGKVIKGETDNKSRHNNPRSNAIIKRAIDAAESIKEYPAHVMVRCETIVRAKNLLISIQEESAEYFPKDSPGWGVTGIWSGSSGIKISSKNHPWMIAKGTNKIQKNSARLLLAVNMGQFGLNNPLCSVVAWTCPNSSIIELVQRIGRCVRIVKSVPPEDQSIVLVFSSSCVPSEDIEILRKGIDCTEEELFEIKKGKEKSSMEKAIDYIRNMESIVSSSFLSLDKKDEDGELLILGSSLIEPLSSYVQYQINEMQGLMLPEGLSAEDIKIFVDLIDDNKDSGLLEQISNYVEKISLESYKDKQFGLPEAADPIQFVFEEECKQSFTRLEMEQYAKAYYSPSVLPHVINDLDAGHSSVVAMLTEQLKNKHSRFHRPSGKFLSVQSILGVNESKTDKFIDRNSETYFGSLKAPFKGFYSKSVLSKEELDNFKSILSKKLYVACAQAFGLPDFKKSNYVAFEAQLSSVMCAPSVKSKIIHRAKALVIEELKDKMPGHYALYVNQIVQFLEKNANGKNEAN